MVPAIRCRVRRYRQLPVTSFIGTRRDGIAASRGFDLRRIRTKRRSSNAFIPIMPSSFWPLTNVKVIRSLVDFNRLNLDPSLTSVTVQLK
jgi:hypothetical protein